MTTQTIAIMFLHAVSATLAAFSILRAMRGDWMPAMFLILAAIWAQP